MLASMFTDHAQFNHMMLFTILPVMFLSGIWWTPYSMGTGFLRTFSNLMPLTMACQALRDVMTRGWDLSYPSVQWGIGSTLIWSLLSNVLTFVVVKIKSKWYWAAFTFTHTALIFNHFFFFYSRSWQWIQGQSYFWLLFASFQYKQVCMNF